MITIDLRNKILDSIDDALVHQIKQHFEAGYAQKTGSREMDIAEHFTSGLKIMFDVYETARHETEKFLDHYKK